MYILPCSPIHNVEDGVPVGKKLHLIEGAIMAGPSRLCAGTLQPYNPPTPCKSLS